MLKKSDIASFLTAMHDNAKAYHACHLQDFYSYLQIGGIPSRELIKERGLSLTDFDTDENDCKNKVWDKVFFNFQDFSNSFARGINCCPIAYGPIMLKMPKAILESADDIAISLRSAGGSNYNRDEESLSILEATTHLINDERWIKSGSDLSKIKELKDKYGSPLKNPEANCSFGERYASFEKHRIKIIVEAISIDGKTLESKVRKILEEHERNFQYEVVVREYKENFDKLYQIFVELCQKHPEHSLKDITKLTQLTDSFKSWCIRNQGLDYQYIRFRNYLLSGTINVFEKY